MPAACGDAPQAEMRRPPRVIVDRYGGLPSGRIFHRRAVRGGMWLDGVMR
jgi:hypothetical protein